MGKDELTEGLDNAFNAAIEKTIREASNATLAKLRAASGVKP